MSDESASRKALAIESLGITTRERMDADAMATYLGGLQVFSDDIVAEACARLSETQEFFPSLSKLRDTCAVVIREVNQPARDEIRTREIQAYQPISKPRAKLWVDHLEAVIVALRSGRTPPPSPSVLESSDTRTTYKCATCRDSGWDEWECPGGHSRNCGRTQYSGFHDKIFYGSCRIAHEVATRCACRFGGHSHATA